MNTLVIGIIKGYHIFVSPILMQIVGQQTVCRYKVTCSEYAVIQIKKHGIIHGSYLGIKRLLTCHSW